MATKIKDKDKGYKKLFAQLAINPTASISVGVHEAEGSATAASGEATLLDVATFHEFGTVSVPRRSFIRDWADENEDKNAEALRKIGAAVVRGKLPSVTVGLARFGALAAGSIQKRISKGIKPALAESTIAAKGSSKPLIDTGQLRSSITFEVTK